MIFRQNVAARLRQLTRDRRGNVLMIFAFAVIPMVFATGMGIDYSRAERLQTKLDAIADAAALAAVSHTMMTETNADACQAARNMFESQRNQIDNLILDTTDSHQFKITLTDASGTYDCATAGGALANKVALRRTVKVTYRGQSLNAFSGVLGVKTLGVNGDSTAFAQISNIDFYLMLDMSQSMLLPATTTDLKTMTGKTGGCAFACHQTNLTYNDPSVKINGKTNPNKTPNTELYCTGTNHTNCIDYYTVARNLGLTLRTDLLGTAVSDLVQHAMDTEAVNKATYRIGVSTFDYGFNQLWPTSGNTSNVSNYWVDVDLQRVLNYVNAEAGSDGKGWSNLVTQYCVNNWRTCSLNDGDTGTSMTAAINGILDKLPAKGGTGTKESPLAVVFLITDGMRDENSGGRKMGPIPYSLCQKLADRNVQIAVLQTQYLPESASDGWSVTNVKDPFLSPKDKISPALYSCAAGNGELTSWPPANGINPGVLFYQVTTDDDISTALVSLFDKAVAQARLTQ